MSVLSTADRVLEATGELRELRSRLTELEAERAIIEQRIRDLLVQIGQSTNVVVPVPAAPAAAPVPAQRGRQPATTSEKILAMIEENPRTAFNTLDFATRWNDISGIDAFRAALSRLTAQGKIRRIRHGWYSSTASRP